MRDGTTVYGWLSRWVLLWWWLVWLPSGVPAAPTDTVETPQPHLYAEVDRTQVEMGDIITLTLTLEKIPLAQSIAPPDFHHALGRDFHIVGQQANSQLMVVKGESFRFEQWTLQLTPRHPGSLRIPAFNIAGATSQPLTLTVQALNSALHDHPLYRFEAQVTPANGLYLHQQGLYTLRLYYRGELINGHVPPPVIPDAQVIRLSNQASYHKVIDGEIYTVYEWRYAFFPRKPGSLTLPSITFKGQLYAEQKLHQLSARTQAFHLNILPPPADWPAGQTWLPVAHLAAAVRWHHADKPLKVGDSLTVDIELKADGIPANLLPDLSPPRLKGVRIYVEPSQPRQIRTTEGIRSQRTFRWTLLFQTAGPHNWPSQLLAWWNTQTRQIEWLKLRGRSFSVQPAEAPSLSPVQPDKAVRPASKSPASLTYWQLATALLVLLNLLLLMLWLRQRYKISESGKAPAVASSHPSSVDGHPSPTARSPCQRPPLQFYQYLLTLPKNHPWRTHPAWAELEFALFSQHDESAARAAQQALCQLSMQKKKTFPSKKSSTQLKSLYS